MASYYLNEAAFELPNLGLVDRTIHILEAARDEGSIGISVFRKPAPPGVSFRALVQDHVAVERRSLRGYSLLSQEDSEIAGAPAIVLACTWRSDQGMVYQRQAHVALAKTCLVFVGTALLEERDACDEMMRGVLSSLTWREET